MAADTLMRGQSVRAAQRRLTALFADAGMETAALDARLLIQQAAGISHEAIIAAPERLLDEDIAARLEAYAARRLGGEPVARIAGVKEFWGRDFVLAPETLVPRPESEVLVEAGLGFLDGRASPVIADLGTGTGCLIVSLLAACAAARGIGVDVSPAALDCARANAVRHGVSGRASFVQGNWLDGLDEAAFDLIVANPPYIPSSDIAGLAPEVARYDPHGALDGGADGLKHISAIASGVCRCLKPGGALVMEVGAGQSGAAVAMLARAGLESMPGRDEISDLAGIARAVKGVKRN